MTAVRQAPITSAVPLCWAVSRVTATQRGQSMGRGSVTQTRASVPVRPTWMDPAVTGTYFLHLVVGVVVAVSSSSPSSSSIELFLEKVVLRTMVVTIIMKVENKCGSLNYIMYMSQFFSRSVHSPKSTKSDNVLPDSSTIDSVEGTVSSSTG